MCFGKQEGSRTSNPNMIRAGPPASSNIFNGTEFVIPGSSGESSDLPYVLAAHAYYHSYGPVAGKKRL
ncbi:hypothetical protein FIBSPDRAFT_847702 [Athelia psychrophila]|uniref:Uncharacterized protein n=1 Tax=Athelia psychrophila TaxID=1759441 RepID=A0A166VV24_9AGAM|nr:hypothetical protein FIBSPDRAFT_847702 [Fibularhizoctonia sp. CBS 109695]